MRTIVSRMILAARAAAVAGTALLGACSSLPLASVEATGTSEPLAAAASTAPDYPKDDVALGKMQFRKGNYGLAELHFRKAVEAAKADPEAWLGLAASYDQLKRYDLADRAYRQALKLTGPTPEYLNNRGYSYLLRGDIRRASQTLAEAQAKDPENEQIANNLRLLDERARKRL